MQVQIMEVVLQKLDQQMILQGRNVILFIDNATVHPPTLQGKYSKIKIVFLPKKPPLTFNHWMPDYTKRQGKIQ